MVSGIPVIHSLCVVGARGFIVTGPIRVDLALLHRILSTCLWNLRLVENVGADNVLCALSAGLSLVLNHVILKETHARLWLNGQVVGSKLSLAEEPTVGRPFLLGG